MEFAPVAKPRSTILDSPAGLTILVPAKKQWPALLFMCLWLGGWAMGEVAALRQVFFGESQGLPDAFLAFWLLGWTAGGLFAISTVLWMLAGSEKITLTPTALLIRKQILGLGSSTSYDLGQITALRVNRNFDQSGNRTGSLPTPGISKLGTVAFDYGAATVRFAAAIEEGEAAMIVQRLTDRYGFRES